MLNDPNFKITIRSRSKLHYQGMAVSLTSVNNTGKFDILGYHANFISLIKDYVLVVTSTESASPLRFDITDGVIYVDNSEVHVYLNTVENLKH
ncbi:MAG: hypothetical protein R3B92_01265 [Patescibacteria group bacterium]